MKLIISLVLILFSFSCFATEYISTENLFEIFLNDIKTRIPEDITIHLEINENEYSSQIESTLMKFLLENHHIVVENAENAFLLKINYTESIKQIGKHKFLTNNKKLQINHNFKFSLINPNSEIIDYELLTYKSLSSIKKTIINEMKWYDPIMISTIVGGLIYLFYYGNK